MHQYWRKSIFICIQKVSPEVECTQNLHLFHNVPGYCSIFWEKEHKMTRILSKKVQGRPCRANSLWRMLTILHKSRRPQVLFPLALVPQLVPFYGQNDQETCPVQWYLLSIVSKYSPCEYTRNLKTKRPCRAALLLTSSLISGSPPFSLRSQTRAARHCHYHASPYMAKSLLGKLTIIDFNAEYSRWPRN